MNTPAQRKLNILLVGDNCLDVYQYGTIDRLSPEAPVPVFVPTYQESKPGMSGNVYNNLINLGCNVNHLYGKTSKKTRLIDQHSRQQIVRIDEDVVSDPLEFATEIPPGYDAIVVSDYNKGSISYELVEELVKEVQCPIFIDTKKHDLQRFQGAWVKVNQHEYSQLKSEPTGLIVTKGGAGAEVPYQNIKSTSPLVEVVDVTGAGDTFLAALTYKFLLTNDIKEAVDFANKAASITVQHLGCYAPRLEEIK